MARILALAGPKHSGKTTIANAVSQILIGSGQTVSRMSFADPMRDMLGILLDYGGVRDPLAVMSDPLRKEQAVETLQAQTPRHLMQTLGTEWGRNLIGVNLWTDIAMSRADRSGADWVIIDDLRFESEKDAITDRDGVCFKLTRTGVEYTLSHESEVGVSAPTVANNGSPEDVARVVVDKLLAK